MLLAIGRFTLAVRLWPTLALVVLLPLLTGLGAWQLGRAQEKTRLAERFAARATQAPVALDDLLRLPRPLDEHRFEPVEGTGRFLPGGRHLLLDNRTRHGVAGYHVLSPFRARGASRAILVDRGWVPADPRRERLPEVALRRPGPRKVRGLLAPAPRPGLLLGDDGYDARGWPRVVQLVDFERAQAALGTPLVPAVLWLDPADPDGFAREWSPYVGIPPQRHRAYAVQWFALAAALIVIYVSVNLRRRHG